MPSCAHNTKRETPNLAESFLLMGTTVTIRVVGDAPDLRMQESIQRAIGAMHAVERACSRFDEDSALRELCRHPGQLTPVPPVLFHALRIACELSHLTAGVFDPTVGRILELQGFNRHYLTGEEISSGVPSNIPTSYRDIILVQDNLSVRLDKPMMLDLGAVAKGLAIDLAAKELGEWDGFAIDAGGDVYVHGVDPMGEVWTVGVEDPHHAEEPIALLRAGDMAICTSGSAKRRSPLDPDIHHLWNPAENRPARGLASCTVVAPIAVLADVSATAAFLLGPDRAIPFIEDIGLVALCVKENGQILQTHTMKEYLT